MINQKSKHTLWAEVVTNVISPPVVFIILALLTLSYAAVPTGKALLFTALYTAVAVLLPVAYILWSTYRGNITDIHMPNRNERYKPFIIGVVSSILTWILLALSGAPRTMMLLASFTVIDMSIIACITYFWQISIHTAAMGGAFAIVGALFGTSGAVVAAPFLVIVGAARLQLRRHTLRQVVAGALVGGSIAIIVFSRM